MRRRRIPIGISLASPEGIDEYLEKIRIAAQNKVAKQQLVVDLLMVIAFDWPGASREIQCFNERLRSYLTGQKLAVLADKQHIRLTPRGKALAAQVRQIATVIFELGGLKP